MEREKQIEEMARDLHEALDTENIPYHECDFLAKLLTAKGYRKERQGEWKPQMQELNYYDTFECSVCEFVIDVSQGDYKYCPNCGSKMKGAE